jgi:hypothetical protein
VRTLVSELRAEVSSLQAEVRAMRLWDRAALPASAPGSSAAAAADESGSRLVASMDLDKPDGPFLATQHSDTDLATVRELEDVVASLREKVDQLDEPATATQMWLDTEKSSTIARFSFTASAGSQELATAWVELAALLDRVRVSPRASDFRDSIIAKLDIAQRQAALVRVRCGCGAST